MSGYPLYDEFEHAGLTVKIHYDQTPEHPRKSRDCLGTLVLQPRRNYGRDTSWVDKNAPKFWDWRDWRFTYDVDEDPLGSILNTPGTVAMALDYSDYQGTVSGEEIIGRVSGDDQYDVDGYLYVTRETWQKEFGWQRLTADRRAQIVKALEYELEELSAYHAGEVYGFSVEDSAGNVLDSCWGYYGPDLEYCIQSAKESAESLRQEIDNEQTASRNRFAESLAAFESTPIIGRLSLAVTILAILLTVGVGSVSAAGKWRVNPCQQYAESMARHGYPDEAIDYQLHGLGCRKPYHVWVPVTEHDCGRMAFDLWQSGLGKQSRYARLTDAGCIRFEDGAWGTR